MGKGKGKKGRREAKLAAKKATEVPKVPGVPRPANPVKKAKKLLSREKKSAINTNPPGPEKFPIPMGRPKPFTKSPQHAKWPALFKKHLGLIESHIRALDRVMQSMKSEMGQMPEKERMEWELGERGNWRVICNMMDQARTVLADARVAAQGILPAKSLKDKKGLGVIGINFEPLGPKLAEKAAELGYTKRGKLGRDPDAVSSDNDSDSDTEMSDSSSSSDDDDAVAEGADFVPLNIGKKPPRPPTAEDSAEDKENNTAANGVESNPYFVVDTNPTPVVLNGKGTGKKSKKRAKEEDGEGKKSKRVKKEKVAIAEEAKLLTTDPEVDFAAIEAKLQAEVEEFEATKARESQGAESSEDKKSKKKRRRSSDGLEGKAEKKIKKGKMIETKNDEAPTAELSILAGESTAKDGGKNGKLSETTPVDEPAGKKEKKEKKRKADANEAEVYDGKKKKRKHKVSSDSE